MVQRADGSRTVAKGAREQIRRSAGAEALRVDLDLEAPKECGRLAEQVRRCRVAKYTPMRPVENYLVACPLEERDTVQAVVMTRRVENGL